MTITDISLLILAIATLVQLGFFIYDRVQAYKVRRWLQLNQTTPAAPTYLGNKGLDLFLIYLGSAALGWLIARMVHRYINAED